jgi:thymidine phosphorylase
VASQPLIVASIMSKKLAENLNRLVLDVKYGSGAFMKTRPEAEQLAQSMSSVGELMGVKMTHLLTPMDEPLGHAVGNALEIAECVETLQGRGPADLVRLVLDLAEKVSDTPRDQLAKRLENGAAWKKFVALVYAQDGDATALEIIRHVHPVPVIKPIVSKSSGTIKSMDAGSIGRASLLLGAGRQQSGDQIDFAVGISGLKKIGESAVKDEPLMFVHARSENSFEQIRPMLESAIVVE